MSEFTGCCKQKRTVNYYRHTPVKNLTVLMQRIMDGWRLPDRQVFMVRERAQELAEDGLLDEETFFMFENWVSNNVTQYTTDENESWADEVQEKFLKGELYLK